MAITGQMVARYIRHSLGGSEPSPELVLLAIANQAGEWLTDAYDWRWKSRAPVTLTAVDGQSYIDLASDFGEMVDHPRHIPGGVVSALRMTTITGLSRIAELDPTGGGPGFFAALVYSARSGTTPPKPRLSLWPTPNATTAGAIAKLWYRACWEPLTDDDQTVALPRYMESLYLQAARAWAQGYEDSDVESSESRLARIQTGPLWAACVARDSGEQNSYGAMDDGPAALAGAYHDPLLLNPIYTPFTP